MKITVNIEKTHIYLIAASVLILSLVLLASGTGYTTGTPYHTTLFADFIKGKQWSAVYVEDSVFVNGTLAVSNSAAPAGNVMQLFVEAANKGVLNYGGTTESPDTMELRLENGPVMSLQSGPKIGVGTTTPAQMFDVAGNVNGQGLCIKGDCRASWAAAGSAPVCTVRPGTPMGGSSSAGCIAGESMTGGGCKCTYGQVASAIPSGNYYTCECGMSSTATAYAICCT